MYLPLLNSHESGPHSPNIDIVSSTGPESNYQAIPPTTSPATTSTTPPSLVSHDVVVQAYIGQPVQALQAMPVEVANPYHQPGGDTTTTYQSHHTNSSRNGSFAPHPQPPHVVEMEEVGNEPLPVDHCG